MNADSDSAAELKQRGFLSRCCSTDCGRIITAVITSLLTGFGLTFVAQLIAKQIITLALQWITVHPFAALANTVLIALIVLVLGWLMRSMFASTFIASIAVMAATALGESCIAYEWEYAFDLDGSAYSTLPDSIDPDKFSTMSWFTRQAFYGKDDVAFYRLRN